MTRPDRVERQWDALVEWLNRKREGVGLPAPLSIEEAQRLVAEAQADPLTSHEVEVLVTLAVRRRTTSILRHARVSSAAMFFSTDVQPVAAEWAGSAAIVSLAGTVAGDNVRWCDEWSTDVNSLTVDTHRLPLPRGAWDARWGNPSAAPVIYDVWSKLDELTEVGSRSGREAVTCACFDSRLDVLQWESAQCTLAVPDWYDFAGYSDEVTEEIRRN